MASPKIPTDGSGQAFGNNPFAGLTSAGLPQGVPQKPALSQETKGGETRKSRGRVDILRETGNRGGKTVTVVAGFVGIGLPEKELLAKKMQKACGCGGTVKDGRIEIQGDKREQVSKILIEAGFRPVFAGG